jgi:hypothetical protein
VRNPADLAGAAAHVACLEPATRLDPGAAAGLASLETGDLELRLQPGRRVFERDLELVLEVLAARGPGPARAGPAGEEVLEDVLEEGAEAGVAESGPGAWGGAETVEMGPLLGIGQHRVRLVGFLESLLGLLVAPIAIGVVLHRELPVGFLDLGVAGIAGHAEHLVVVAGHRTQASSSGAAATDTSAARSTRLCSAYPGAVSATTVPGLASALTTRAIASWRFGSKGWPSAE